MTGDTQTNAPKGHEGSKEQENTKESQKPVNDPDKPAAKKEGSAEARVLLAYSDKSGDYQPNNLIKASKTAIEELVKQGFADDSKEAVKYAKSLVKAAAQD